ncbi:MAG: hypothetical protein SFU86_24720 [Pirellulaceae bacterium]|nr:hypothetical protein [Pirellulaceae bacterium]
MTESAKGPNIALWIIAALVAWGGYLAVGSYLHGRTMLWQRSAIVFGVVVLFAGFWLVMLAARRRRLAREEEE